MNLVNSAPQAFTATYLDVNGTTNCSELDTLQFLPAIESKWQVILFLSICLPAIVINFVIILVLYRLRSSTGMQYYLITIALWDISMLCSASYIIGSPWLLSKVGNPYRFAFPYVYALSVVSPVASIWILLLLTVKRYWLISRPFSRKTNRPPGLKRLQKSGAQKNIALLKSVAVSTVSVFHAILIFYEVDVIICTENDTQTKVAFVMSRMRRSDAYKLCYQILANLLLNNCLPMFVTICMLIHITLIRRRSRDFRHKSTLGSGMPSPFFNRSPTRTVTGSADSGGSRKMLSRLSPKMISIREVASSGSIKNSSGRMQPQATNRRRSQTFSNAHNDTHMEVNDVDIHKEVNAVLLTNPRIAAIKQQSNPAPSDQNQGIVVEPAQSYVKAEAHRSSSSSSVWKLLSNIRQSFRKQSSAKRAHDKARSTLSEPCCKHSLISSIPHQQSGSCIQLSATSKNGSFRTGSTRGAISRAESGSMGTRRGRLENNDDIILLCITVRLLLVGLLSSALNVWEFFVSRSTHRESHAVKQVGQILLFLSAMGSASNFLLYLCLGVRFRDELAYLLRLKKRPHSSITLRALRLAASKLNSFEVRARKSPTMLAVPSRSHSWRNSEKEHFEVRMRLQNTLRRFSKQKGSVIAV